MQSISTKLTPFHVALQVRDIAEARSFYSEVLGCPEGRSAENWIDFNLFGHQFVVHFNPAIGAEGKINQLVNPVDGHGVPIPHCGVVLEMDHWKQLSERLASHQVEWVIEPYIRFPGEPSEQATMFILDPSGNALEFKAFVDIESQLFAS